MRKPLLSILDESTSALDNETERNVLNELTMTSKTLIATTHRPGLLKFATQVVLMKADGSIDCIGSYEELSAKSKNFKKTMIPARPQPVVLSNLFDPSETLNIGFDYMSNLNGTQNSTHVQTTQHNTTQRNTTEQNNRAAQQSNTTQN